MSDWSVDRRNSRFMNDQIYTNQVPLDLNLLPESKRNILRLISLSEVISPCCLISVNSLGALVIVLGALSTAES